MPAAGEQLRVVRDPEDCEEQRDEGGDRCDVRRRQARHETHRQRREVVGDLALRDLGRAQPDDRQHAEESEPQSEGDLGRAEHARDGKHAHVDAKERHDQVATVMPAVIEGEAQDGSAKKVDGDQEERGNGHEVLRSVFVTETI